MFESYRPRHSDVSGGGATVFPDPSARPIRDAADPAGRAMPDTEPVLDWQRVRGRLWAARGYSLLLGITGLIVAGLYASSLPNQFVATSEVLLDPNDLRIIQNDVRPQDQKPNAAETYTEDQARILSSPDLLRTVVGQEKLASDPEFTQPTGLAALLDRVEHRSDTDDSEATRTEKAVESLGKALTVTRSTRSLIVDIAVRTSSPAKSASISNAILAAYLAQDAQVRASIVGNANEALNRRLADLSDRVQRAENDVAAYRRRAGILGGGKGHDLSEDQVAAMDALVTAARGRAVDAKTRLQALQGLSPDSALLGTSADQVRSSTLGNLMLQLATLRQQQADMGTQLSFRHPNMVGIKAKVTQARADVSQELRRRLDGAITDDKQAQHSLADLEQQFSKLRGQAFAMDDKSVKLRELQRKADAERAVYESFLARSRETDELRSVNASNTRIVSEAVPPLNKSGPHRTVMTLGGGLLGALFGGFLGMLPSAASRRRTAPR